jgi:hypothetical protein
MKSYNIIVNFNISFSDVLTNKAIDESDCCYIADLKYNNLSKIF